MSNKSVILVSGGLDSAANLAFSVDSGEPILAITIRYGQRASAQEVEAARKFTAYYQVPHRVVDLPWLGDLGGSSLTQGSSSVPQVKHDELDNRSVTDQSARAVWVPNRNGIFIHVAAAFAERMGAEQVIVGFNVEEAATFPDNSEAYLNQVTGALAFSTANQVKVFSYTSAWNKKQIVSKLTQLSRKFPFEYVWSCYLGESLPCGKCESCQRLLRATSGLASRSIP